MIKKFVYYFFAAILISSVVVSSSKAFAYDDFYAQNDILFYSPGDSECPGSDFALDLSGPVGEITDDLWVSGATPDQYSLERFAIEVLKYIAKRKGVNETDTITKEHVIALVSFMMGEGGDIANRWLFNPLNSGLSNEKFVDGPAKNDGTQSFKSFDAGITATGITMLGPNQSRLSGILIKKDSTAKEFMKVLTYYLDYPGNKFWASASTGEQADEYYQGRLSIVSGVRKNYNTTAGIRMGTAELEQDAEMYVPSESLMFNTSSDPADTDPTGGCTTTSLISGGMGLAEAKLFVNEYKKLEPKTWTSGTPGTPYKINGTGCNGGPLANCVAFSQYFINRYTTKTYVNTSNGEFVVGDLLGLGFADGAHVPKVYSVFSKEGDPYGHTGVVLGIDIANNKIIIGEAGCGQSLDWTDAREKSLSEFSGDVYTYAYTDGFLKGDAL